MMTDKDLNNMILNPGAWSQVEMVHDDLLVCRIPTKGKAPPCRLSLKYQNLRGDDQLDIFASVVHKAPTLNKCEWYKVNDNPSSMIFTNDNPIAQSYPQPHIYVTF